MSKLALVTGGATRIGAAITSHLAQQGWEVIIHYKSSDKKAQALSKSLQARYKGKSFPVVGFDLSNWKEIEGFWNKIVRLYSAPDLLVNNASLFQPGRLSHTSTALMESMLNINFLAPFYLSQAFVRSTNAGSVINLLDTAIETNSSVHAAYLLAKKNLAEFTRMAALEWAPAIRVNAIAPGPVLPPPDKNEEYLSTIVKDTPLQQIVAIESINAGIAYILANKNITGNILFCDSGQHLL